MTLLVQTFLDAENECRMMHKSFIWFWRGLYYEANAGIFFEDLKASCSSPSSLGPKPRLRALDNTICNSQGATGAPVAKTVGVVVVLDDTLGSHVLKRSMSLSIGSVKEHLFPSQEVSAGAKRCANA